MVKVFSHWFPIDTVFQAVLELITLFFSVVLVIAWISRGSVPNIEISLLFSILFAFSMMLLNSLLGLYHRDLHRNFRQLLTRGALSLLLAIPVAFGIFEMLPAADMGRDVLKVAAVLAVCGLLAIRGYAGSTGLGPVLVRRVLVVGTGSEAALVEQSLKDSGQGIEIVGFYPVQTDDSPCVSRERIIYPGLSLADTTRTFKVDEVIVAVRERRGGAMPLDGLLDCKLEGVSVLDLATYFERGSWSTPTGFLACGLVDLWRRL